MITYHRIHTLRVAYLLLGVLAPAAGCLNEAPIGPMTVTSGRPIINGTVDTSPEHMAVVALVPPASSGYVGMHCSGTLITPTVVMTAAHCVDGYSVGGFDIFFGNNVWQSGTRRSVSEIRKHPSYGGQQNPVNDIALVRLASAAPATVTPIPFLPASLGLTSADEGSPVVFAGFGQTENNTTGVKLKVTSSIGKVCPGPSGCSYGGAWVVAKAFGYPQSPGGPCSGDSGGPAFVTRGGTEYLAGVTSYGDEYCAQYGVSIMPQSYDAWVLEFTGGHTAEICDNGIDDDGDTLIDCADPDCAQAPGCLPPTACETADSISCGAQVSGTTVGGSTRFTNNSCLSNPEQGPEKAYELQMSPGTTVTATLTPQGTGDLDLFLFPASGSGCDPQGCLASSMNEGAAQETITFVMPAGGAYLVVETWDVASPFTLQVSCPGQEVEICNNGVDDNGNDLIDCADPQCAEAPHCQGGQLENCTNGVDDDGDDLIDCDDPDCAQASHCQGLTPGPGVTKGGCHCQQSGNVSPIPVAIFLLLALCFWRRRTATRPR